jgi:hypothetical protein
LVNFRVFSIVLNAKISEFILDDAHDAKFTLLQTWDVTSLPPCKNLIPRFLRTREKGRVLGSMASLSFPSCFLFGMTRPLNFEELDGLTSSFSSSFIKDKDRILSIGEIFLKIKSGMINSMNWIFKETLELRHMEYIMNIWKC